MHCIYLEVFYTLRSMSFSVGKIIIKLMQFLHSDDRVMTVQNLICLFIYLSYIKTCLVQITTGLIYTTYKTQTWCFGK